MFQETASGVAKLVFHIGEPSATGHEHRVYAGPDRRAPLCCRCRREVAVSRPIFPPPIVLCLVPSVARIRAELLAGLIANTASRLLTTTVMDRRVSVSPSRALKPEKAAAHLMTCLRPTVNLGDYAGPEAYAGMPADPRRRPALWQQLRSRSAITAFPQSPDLPRPSARKRLSVLVAAAIAARPDRESRSRPVHAAEEHMPHGLGRSVCHGPQTPEDRRSPSMRPSRLATRAACLWRDEFD
jgi:hypothetical protein